ncbi:MAG: PorT family protein [Bacteroidetes bacterium]|nr:MAG: PorT family protein [Bacteroidota bacterium]
MREHYFDELIRTKLQALKVPYEETDWLLLEARLPPPLDTLFRSKLAGMAVPYRPEDWLAFSAQLQQAGLPDHSSPIPQASHAYDANLPLNEYPQEELLPDAQLQNALQKLEVPYEPREWDLFAARLHGDFDNSVRAQLENYQAAYQPADWELLAERLNQPFYAVVRSKIGWYQAPFRRADWWRMAARLQMQQGILRPQNRKRLFAYATAAVFVLLMVTALSLSRLTRQHLSPQPTLATQQQAVEEAPTTAPPEATAQAATTPALPRQSQAAPAASLAEAAGAQLPEEVPSISGLHSPPQHTLLSSPISVPNNSLQNQAGPAVPPELSQPSAGGYTTAALDGVPISPIDPAKAEYGLLSRLLNLEEIQQVENPSSSFVNPDVHLGLYGGYSSSMAELTNHGELGYHLGLRVELAFGESWRVVSGIAYSQKRFEHQYRIFGSNSNYERLLDADFQAVEIPALVRYTFPSTDKLALYMQAGIITMITTRESYLIYDPTSVANAGAPQHVDLRKLAPKNQLRSFHTYVGNVHTALGLEYELSKRINLQLEPYFQLGLQAMGSEEKRLYAAGVNLATVYRFGSRNK